jgi:hypothetical protein
MWIKNKARSAWLTSFFSGHNTVYHWARQNDGAGGGNSMLRGPRVERFGLHVRLARSFARPDGHAGSLHGDPRECTIQFEANTPPKKRLIGFSKSSPKSSPIFAQSLPIGIKRKMSRQIQEWDRGRNVPNKNEYPLNFIPCFVRASSFFKHFSIHAPTGVGVFTTRNQKTLRSTSRSAEANSAKTASA